MLSFSTATELYLMDDPRRCAILLPDPGNIPRLIDPQPIVLCAAYLSAAEVAEPMTLARMKARLNTPQCELFVPLPCPDGPPCRSGMIFAFQEYLSGVAWTDGSHSSFGAKVRRFAVTTPNGQWGWTNDARSGRSGYFVTGHSEFNSLWRVFRVEGDAISRNILTLAPIMQAPGCPKADFSRLDDAALKEEMRLRYEAFCASVSASAYLDVPNKARFLVEGLVAAKLQEQGHPPFHALGKDLELIKKCLENRETRHTCGWTDIEYHLAHKVRLVHGQTQHPGSIVESGRPVTPEFALSVVQDLAELLRIWGYALA